MRSISEPALTTFYRLPELEQLFLLGAPPDYINNLDVQVPGQRGDHSPQCRPCCSLNQPLALRGFAGIQ